MNVDQALKERYRFPKPETGPQKWVNRAAVALDGLFGDPKRIAKFLKAQHEYRAAYLCALYADCDPKEVPIDDLVEIAQYSDSGDAFIAHYKERVRSPLTGIRAYCMKCQGGSLEAVRNCPSANCPLWGFRMGNNPFFGRLTNADAESDNEPVVEEAVQPADLFEQGGDR